jgi:hypothetical protein
MISDTNLLYYDKNTKGENDTVLTLTITVESQHLSEIRILISSVEHTEDILGYVNRKENFLAETYPSNPKQTKINDFFFFIKVKKNK